VLSSAVEVQKILNENFILEGQSAQITCLDFFLRSGLKTSDQVQGQGVRPIGKAQHTWVCEHLPEAVLHLTLKNQMRIPRKRGNAAIGHDMGF
jgi:hypothetical protein